jgi:hypothetical protein
MVRNRLGTGSCYGRPAARWAAILSPRPLKLSYAGCHICLQASGTALAYPGITSACRCRMPGSDVGAGGAYVDVHADEVGALSDGLGVPLDLRRANAGLPGPGQRSRRPGPFAARPDRQVPFMLG